MSIFSQQHSKISTFYLLTRENQQMKAELRQQGRNKKAVLIIPVLATEFTMPENRPVFERIVHQIKDATYLSKIIFGLDGATTGEAEQLERILHHYNLKNYLIQHNDGDHFASFYHTLSEAGFGFDEPGKGRNMFLSFGIAL
ncbi:MAG: hypothetical protein JXD19_09575, partial [Deltaproteobacteria bacterium]|nr:hypothetical protein [Deltaproteobacteria bacterium]